MDVTIKGRNVKITETLEGYAKKKLDKLDRYLPNIHDVRVDLSHEHTRRGEDLMGAQITVRHERGAILRAEERIPGDINKAIDSAVDKMYRRIQRFKSKRSRKGKERFVATLEELDLAEEIPEIEEYVDEYAEQEGFEERPAAEAAATPVERRKDIQLAPMSEAEAIEQMELLGHNFFLFFNADTGKINALYKRATGGYGILVPQAP
jgi:putative sigma-54 modulation protein